MFPLCPPRSLVAQMVNILLMIYQVVVCLKLHISEMGHAIPMHHIIRQNVILTTETVVKKLATWTVIMAAAMKHPKDMDHSDTFV
jgi:hypothetical protein